MWLDLWIAYNPDGISFMADTDDGQVQMNISQDELNSLKPTVRIDVSPDNQWTKLAEQQSLDNMFMQQQLTLEEYVEATPDNSSIPKAKLKAIIDKRKQQEQQMMMQQQQMMMQQQTQNTGEIDPQIVLQQLISQGVPEEEAIAMVQSM